MITIEQVNEMLARVNKINFMVADIVDQIGDYTILTRVGTYMPISEEVRYNITDEYVIVHTQCIIGRTRNGSWVRDETVRLKRSWFNTNASLSEIYDSIYKKQLNKIKDEISKKKKEIEKQYNDILGAEYLIENYMRKGLSIEFRQI